MAGRVSQIGPERARLWLLPMVECSASEYRSTMSALRCCAVKGRTLVIGWVPQLRVAIYPAKW